jgi:hypothetical protein
MKSIKLKDLEKDLYLIAEKLSISINIKELFIDVEKSEILFCSSIDVDKSLEKYQRDTFEYNTDLNLYDGEVDAFNDLQDVMNNKFIQNELKFTSKIIDPYNVDTGAYRNLNSYIYELEAEEILDIKKKMKESDSDNIFNSQEARSAFCALAEGQRGDPEIKMVSIQRNFGSGVLQNLIEHVGDLSHRMSQGVYINNDSIESCLTDIEPKIFRALSSLNSGYGFEREANENVISNYTFAETEYNSREKTIIEYKQKKHTDLQVKIDLLSGAESHLLTCRNALKRAKENNNLDKIESILNGQTKESLKSTCREAGHTLPYILSYDIIERERLSIFQKIKKYGEEISSIKNSSLMREEFSKYDELTQRYKKEMRGGLENFKSDYNVELLEYSKLHRQLNVYNDAQSCKGSCRLLR